MAAGNTYEAIATYTVSSSQTSYTFSSIPSTYTDLILIGNVETNATVDIWLRFNGDSSNNYSRTIVFGNGTSAGSVRDSNVTNLAAAYGATTNSTFQMNFMNYANTTTNKTMLSRTGPANLYTVAVVGLYRSTSAINQIQISCNGSDTFSTGSTFSLYGIKAA